MAALGRQRLRKGSRYEIGKYTVRSEIEIRRPPEDVYGFVADSENDPEWAPLVPEVTRIGDGENNLGRYRFVQRFGPMQREGTIEILSASAPTDLRGVERVMGGTLTFSYHLEPTGAGTRFVHTNEVRWSWAMRLMQPVQRVVTKRLMNRQLGILKSTLEREGPSPTAP